MSGWGLALFVSHLLIFKLPTFQSSLFKIKSNALSDVHLSFMAQYSKPRVGSLVARSRMVDRILASFKKKYLFFFKSKNSYNTSSTAL